MEVALAMGVVRGDPRPAFPRKPCDPAGLRAETVRDEKCEPRRARRSASLPTCPGQINFDWLGRPSRTCPTISKLANCACTCWITVCTSRKRRSNGLLSKIAVAPAA
jgi:hypothetical protein